MGIISRNSQVVGGTLFYVFMYSCILVNAPECEVAKMRGSPRVSKSKAMFLSQKRASRGVPGHKK